MSHGTYDSPRQGTYGITNPPCFLGFVGRLDQSLSLRHKCLFFSYNLRLPKMGPHWIKVPSTSPIFTKQNISPKTSNPHPHPGVPHPKRRWDPQHLVIRFCTNADTQCRRRNWCQSIIPIADIICSTSRSSRSFASRTFRFALVSRPWIILASAHRCRPATVFGPVEAPP